MDMQLLFHNMLLNFEFISVVEEVLEIRWQEHLVKVLMIHRHHLHHILLLHHHLVLIVHITILIALRHHPVHIHHICILREERIILHTTLLELIVLHEWLLVLWIHLLIHVKLIIDILLILIIVGIGHISTFVVVGVVVVFHVLLLDALVLFE